MYAQRKSSAAPRRNGYNRPVPTRLRMGLVMRRGMDFGELGDVEGALRAEGVGLAPISTGDASLQGLWTALYTPSISLPAALGPNAMPIGVQLVAPRWADRALLEMALWMQREAGITQPPRD